MKAKVEAKLGPAGAGDLGKEGKKGSVLFSTGEQDVPGIELTGLELAQDSELSGVLCKGVQYYDFAKIRYINNNGIANLIALMKSLLKQGIQVEFVNVNKKVKEKLKAVGLDSIIKCN
jgi:ABC-type transporter Mla MlaB component